MKGLPRMSSSRAMHLALSHFMPRPRSPRARNSLNPDVQAARMADAEAKRARRRERNLRELAFLRPQT